MENHNNRDPSWVWFTLSNPNLDMKKWTNICNSLKDMKIDIQDVGYCSGYLIHENKYLPNDYVCTIPEGDLDKIKNLLSESGIKGEISVRGGKKDAKNLVPRYESNQNKNDSNFKVSTKEINSLIRKSFGLFYQGNYHIYGGFDGSLSDYDSFTGRENTLEFIAKPTILDPQFGCGVAGLLGTGGLQNSDGSVIAVRKDKKKYIKGAEKYAQLYKEKFNKDVEIVYLDDFDGLISGVGIGSMSPFSKNFGFK